MPRPIPFTDDALREAVPVSTSFRDLCFRLDVSVGGSTYTMIKKRIARLGLDASHIPLGPGSRPTPTRTGWTTDQLRIIVRDSNSVAQVLRSLGYAPSGGAHRWIKARFRALDIDTSHFTGQSWAAGRSNPGGHRRRPLSEILVAGSVYGSSDLRRRLIAEGLKTPNCEICGLGTWRNAALPLALDHINGEPTDNRIENLRILCPNCHAQTATWCGRNRKRA